MAQKIGDVRAELAEVQADYAEVLADLGKIIDAVRRHHDDEHDGTAELVSVFRFCRHSVCRLGAELDDAWSEVLP